MDQIELAWAAGFFDGEGNIGFYYSGSKCKRLELCIGQNNDEVLYRFNVATGQLGKIYGPYNKNNIINHHYRYIATNSANVYKVFLLIKPYLSRIKVEQGIKAINEYNKHRHDNCIFPARWERYKEALSKKGITL